MTRDSDTSRSIENLGVQEPYSLLTNRKQIWLVIGVMAILATVSLIHLYSQQIALWKAMNQDYDNLVTYRSAMEPVRQWAVENKVASIGYIQYAPSSRAEAAKRTISQYLLAPLLLTEPTKSIVLVNLSNDSRLHAFEQSNGCRMLKKFALGVALVEKNP